MLQQLEAIQGSGAMRISPVVPCKLNLQKQQPAAPQRVRLSKVSVVNPRCRMAEPSGKPAPMGQKTVYKDSWMENFILRLCVRRLGKITGAYPNSLERKNLTNSLKLLPLIKP